MFSLKGHVALVTGAGQGVGAEIARVLARQGAAIAVNDMSAERADAVVRDTRASGASALAVIADVTDTEALRAGTNLAIRELGPIDILVNNAGLSPDGFAFGDFAAAEPASWHGPIDLNLYGVLNCCHAVLPTMAERGWGRIVTIVSEAGRVGERGAAVYGAAKAAAASLCRSLAKELGSTGVTVNAVSLGAIATNTPVDSVRLAAQVRRYPAGRLGRPEDVAPAVLWLTSEEAGWVTGQTIVVNGGYATS